MTPSERLSVARTAKVNHAGEFGAIRIYGAQILVARCLFPRLVPQLAELRGHEIHHAILFRDAMRSRDSRPCRATYFWGIGGWLLGFASALMGPNMVWVCTEAVEDTVHQHLTDQLAFLRLRDAELYQLIAGIRIEEEGHLDLARREKGAANWITRVFGAFISRSVDLVIWLSTWGDSSRMRRDLRGLT